MNYERVGEIRIDSANYGKKTMNRAVRNGWHVRFFRDKGRSIQVFAGRYPEEKGPRKWIEQHLLIPRRVKKELESGEKVGMSFYLPVPQKQSI
jgi:hypothetical protein